MRASLWGGKGGSGTWERAMASSHPLSPLRLYPKGERGDREIERRAELLIKERKKGRRRGKRRKRGSFWKRGQQRRTKRKEAREGEGRKRQKSNQDEANSPSARPLFVPGMARLEGEEEEVWRSGGRGQEEEKRWMLARSVACFHLCPSVPPPPLLPSPIAPKMATKLVSGGGEAISRCFLVLLHHLFLLFAFFLPLERPDTAPSFPIY